MHSNCRLLPDHIVCKFTQRNNMRRTNTCDPALKLLHEEVTCTTHTYHIRPIQQSTSTHTQHFHNIQQENHNHLLSNHANTKLTSNHINHHYAPFVTLTHNISSTAPTYVPHCHPGFVDRPRRVTALLTKWKEKLAGGLQEAKLDPPPPLSRVKRVGSQQQERYEEEVQPYRKTHYKPIIIMHSLNYLLF